jgi:hypothetical protein
MQLPDGSWEWSCDLCFPGRTEVGKLGECYALMYHEGKFHLLAGYGHNGDIIHTFETAPWPDPDPENREDLSPEELERANKWMDDAHDEFWREEVRGYLALSAEEGHCLVDTCRELGFGTGSHRLFHLWLYDRLGKMAADHGYIGRN